MADLSKLELTDATVVTIKDNSQANSDHRHYEKDIVPLVHKVYESTSYYATTSGDYATSTWYFASIKPDSWYLPWKAKFRIHSYCPNYPANESITYTLLTGRSDGMSYANWNELQTTAHCYIVWYPLKKAGFDSNYEHAIGVSIYNANNYTSSSYYRTFEIDYYECENCTVTILDTPLKWADWTGGNTTNYGSLVSSNASARGLQETGDANSSGFIERPYYSMATAGGNGLKAYSLFARLPNGTYSSFTTDSGTGVKTFDTTTSFDFSQIYYLNRNSDIAVGSTTGTDQFRPAFALNNMQYSFNGVTTKDTTSSLIKQKYLYLVVSHDWKLVSPYYTQTPTASTSVYYVLLGFMSDCYRLDFWYDTPIYEYDGTNFKRVNPVDALTVNGHTVGTDVPSTAVFTDEKVYQRQTRTPSGEPDIDLPLLLSNSDSVQGETALVYKNRGLTFNHNTATFSVESSGGSVFEVNGSNSSIDCSADIFISDGYLINIVEGDITITGDDGDIFIHNGNIDTVSLNGVAVGNSPEFTDTQSDWNASSGKAQILNKPTLGTASAKDVPTSGNANTSQVVMGNDTRLTDARTPSSHTHGNIQNNGTLQTNDVAVQNGDKLVVTDANATTANSVVRSSIAFDGSTATKCLTQKGTWENFSNNAGTVTSVKVGTTSYNPTSGVVSLPAYPTTLPASDTTSTYSATGTVPVNGTAVASAINGLDVTGESSISANKTISAWSESDGKVSISTQDISITKSQVSDFSHTHGNISNGGAITATAVTPADTDYLLMSDTSNSGKIERGIAIGTDTTKFLRNDGTWQVPSGGSGSVGQIYYCETDSTSTTTAFVVNATGVSSLTNGLVFHALALVFPGTDIHEVLVQTD